MKRLLPGRLEIMVFLGMAIVAGLLVGSSSQQGAALFLATLPIFLVASLLGLRRHFVLLEVREERPRNQK